MKRKIFYGLAMVFIVLMMSGCAVFMGSTIPAPRAGYVLIINPNEWTHAHSWLFNGYHSRRDLIAVDPNSGGPIWAIEPIEKIIVKPAVTRDFDRGYNLYLPPESYFTLFVVWTRFRNRIIDMDTISFDTSTDPYRESYTDMFGQKVYADKVLRLPLVSTEGTTNLRIKKTIYLADWLKALVGLY